MGESAGAATAVASVLSSPTQAADQQQLKMDSKLVFPLTLLLLATIIDSGSGLNCYQCNSYEHALCADPFFHEPTEEGQLQGPAKSGNDFLKPCPADTVDKKHFCRKIYQNVRGDERVIRSCGWIMTRGRGRATQQFWKSTTQTSALATMWTVATLPPRVPSL